MKNVLLDAIKNSGLNFDVSNLIELLFNKTKLGGGRMNESM
jgi:hypothetical protein